jgi:hypothetical protein
MTKRPRTLTLLLLATAAVCAATASTGRGEDAPMVFGRRERGPWLTLDPVRGSVGLNGIFQYDHSTSGGTSSDSTVTLLQQTVSLSTGGSVVSPNLLNWRASGTFGVGEEWDHSPQQSESAIDLFSAYDLRADILRTSELPVSVFASRGESYVNRAFAALLRNTTDRYGATVNWRSPVLPSTLQVSHTRTVQDTLAGEVQYILDEDQLQFETQWEPNDQHHVTFNYEYNGVDQNNPLAINNAYELHNATATHTWQIDPEGRYSLTQFVNFSTQSGDFPYTQFRASELLRMRHTEDFETSLNYAYDRQEYSTSVTGVHSASAGFTHRLFTSLTTTGQVGGSISDRTFFGEQEGNSQTRNFFGNLGVNYTKKVPFGQFTANLGGGYSQSDNGAIGGTQQIFNEFQTLSDSRPLLLTRTGLEPDSIMVFNAAGTRQYIRGIDYTVRKVGNVVQLDRVVGGNIEDDSTVRLNYDLVPLPGYTATTTTFNAGARYDLLEGPLTGLGFFARYAQQDQSISSSSSLLLPENVRDIIFGTDYKFWKITLRAEQEYRDSTLAAMDATRFSARYADRINDRTTLSLTATQSFINYPMDDTQTALTTVDGRMDYQITTNLRSRFTARWRYDDDTRIGRTMGFEEDAELRWQVRQTDVFLRFRHTALDSNGNEGNSLLFSFGLTRNF